MVNLDYLYNPEIAKPYFERNRFIDKKLGFQVIENGMIVPRYIAANGASIPNGIVDSNGKLVKSSCFLYGLGRDYTPPRINSTQLGNCHLCRNVSSVLRSCLNG